MSFDFHNVLELLTSFQATFFALYLLSGSRKIRASNALIAFFLLLLAINISYNFISPSIEKVSVNLSVIIMMTAYFMAPALYLYIKSSLVSRFSFSWIDSIHLLPFIVFNIVIIPSVYLTNLSTSSETTDIDNKVNQFLYIAFYSEFFIYLALGFRLLWKAKSLYFENYSNTDIRRFNYLFQLNSIVSIVIIASGMKNYIIFQQEGKFIENSVYIVLLLILILFCWIIFKGLNSPELFNSEITKLQPVSELLKEEKEFVKQNTSIKPQVLNEISEKHLDKVKDYMEEAQPYLDASLSLSQLAKQTHIPVRDLSLLINHNLNQHFFDFVNEYRINQAKKILIDPDKSDYTVLEILYDVGFNSKSSFNTAFKKVTGLTPTQFRKSQS